MTAHFVHAPITACGGCWTDYDREQWIVLALVETRGTVEHRRCEGVHPSEGPCKRIVKFDMDGIEKMRAFIPLEEYAEMWPESSRLTDRVVRARPASMWQRMARAWQELTG